MKLTDEMRKAMEPDPNAKVVPLVREDEIHRGCQAFADLLARCNRPEFALDKLQDMLAKKQVHFSVNLFYVVGKYTEGG